MTLEQVKEWVEKSGLGEEDAWYETHEGKTLIENYGPILLLLLTEIDQREQEIEAKDNRGWEKADW